MAISGEQMASFERERQRQQQAGVVSASALGRGRALDECGPLVSGPPPVLLQVLLTLTERATELGLLVSRVEALAEKALGPAPVANQVSAGAQQIGPAVPTAKDALYDLNDDFARQVNRLRDAVVRLEGFL